MMNKFASYYISIIFPYKPPINQKQKVESALELLLKPCYTCSTATRSACRGAVEY